MDRMDRRRSCPPNGAGPAGRGRGGRACGEARGAARCKPFKHISSAAQARTLVAFQCTLPRPMQDSIAGAMIVVVAATDPSGRNVCDKTTPFMRDIRQRCARVKYTSQARLGSGCRAGVVPRVGGASQPAPPRALPRAPRERGWLPFQFLAPRRHGGTTARAALGAARHGALRKCAEDERRMNENKWRPWHAARLSVLLFTSRRRRRATRARVQDDDTTPRAPGRRDAVIDAAMRAGNAVAECYRPRARAGRVVGSGRYPGGPAAIV